MFYRQVQRSCTRGWAVARLDSHIISRRIFSQARTQSSHNEYIFLDQTHQHQHQEQEQEQSKHLVCFILGGPGAGKGTQCDLLLQRYRLHHLSIGELLREELARYDATIEQGIDTETEGCEAEGAGNGSYGGLIGKAIREGKMLPGYVTVSLLQNAMDRITREQQLKYGITHMNGRQIDESCDGDIDLNGTVTRCDTNGDTNGSNGSGGRLKPIPPPFFIVDGFPRTLENMQEFESQVGPCKAMILLRCTSQMMKERLLQRGRCDDDINTIWRRLLRYEKETKPVIRRFQHDSRKFIVTVDGTESIEAVSEHMDAALKGVAHASGLNIEDYHY